MISTPAFPKAHRERSIVENGGFVKERLVGISDSVVTNRIVLGFCPRDGLTGRFVKEFSEIRRLLREMAFPSWHGDATSFSIDFNRLKTKRIEKHDFRL